METEMNYCDCDACAERTLARRPNKGFWALIVAFWAASFALGFGAVQSGWTFVLVATWAALATSVVVLARRATSWTCSACGSSVAPPTSALAPPLTGSFRRLQHQNA